MVDADYESLSLEELTHILKEVSRILDKRVKSEIGQYRSAAQKFAELFGLEVKQDTGDKMKEGKERGEKRTKIYRHPENESQVWAGPGRKPKWLTDLIKSGRNLDEFLVTQTSDKEVPPAEGVKEETKEVKTELRF